VREIKRARKPHVGIETNQWRTWFSGKKKKEGNESMEEGGELKLIQLSRRGGFVCGNGSKKKKKKK